MVKGRYMKALFICLFLISTVVKAQDPATYLNIFDNKVYSLKNRGIKDFVVDIVSPKINKQLNDQLIFGRVDEVIFRTYWTANPERVAIEILGLPDGFKEVKDELKLSILSIVDAILPPTMQQRFAGYKFSAGKTTQELEAKDTTGLAHVQSYIFQFDPTGRLIGIEGKKAVGELKIVPNYVKESFSDSKWVLKSLKTTQSENGQVITVKKDYSYGTSQGIAVVSRLSMQTEQEATKDGGKALNFEENIEFKNYKINAGEALKYFLGDAPRP
jgi:hypothetical protein